MEEGDHLFQFPSSNNGTVEFVEMNKKRRNAGVALLSVMAIAAVTGALAYHVVSLQSLTISHSSISLNMDSALSYALGAEEFAKRVLAEDALGEAETGFDSEIEDWANLIAPFEVPNGTINVRIIDLASRFNANSVADPENTVAQTGLKVLCEELGLDVSVAARIIDWVDKDTETTPNGGEDWDYAIYNIPFRTPNSFAMDITEFSFFAPLLRDAQREFEKHITVLPTANLGVNVNTASEPVLKALLPESESALFLEGFVEEERAYETVQSASNVFPAFTPIEDYLSVKSDFFELHVTITIGLRTRLDLTSTMYRAPGRGDVTVYKRDLARRHDWTIENEEYDYSG